MAALLHDIDEWKFSDSNTTDTTVTEQFLKSIGVADSTQDTIEGKVVQDVD